ncbi:MAG TPA: UDP-glucuronic acid decarboxylase family protein [Dehalococcoidia bacterium]|nr:UDP-glucuronic acid decarboxylase family protein [Dehalococcoidia bacterium]
MRTVVAGGAGFIGSHLCRRLLAEGHEVLCLDNLSTGRRSNIAALETEPRFTFLEHDVIGPLGFAADVIFHLASPASPPGYLRRPVETMRVNSEGTLNLLEQARRNGAAFLLASTSEIYGDPLEHPQRESYWGNVNSIGRRACYDEGKRYAEALTMTFVHEYRLDARIVRIFNTYGPNSDPEDGRLVPNFICTALRGEPLPIYGSGEQTRSLCYVDDLVEGLMRTAFTPAARGEVINLGNPDEHRVIEFAERIRALCGSASSFAYSTPALGDDPRQRKPDIGKANRLLDWSPRVDLEAGLSATVEYFRQELGLAAAQAV